MRRAHLCSAIAAAVLICSGAHAQDWPTRPPTLVVPFAAGGGVDTTARSFVPRLAELLGQQIVVENVGGSGGMIGGNVKAIVNLGPRRTPVLSGLATAAEQGLPDVTMTSWTAFFFPKATPMPIVKRFSQALHGALETPSVRTRLEGLGLATAAPEERTPEFAARFIAAEIEKWGKPIRASGISAD